MSKEAKFTKGEWLIDKSSYIDGYWGISVKDKGIAHYHFIEVLRKIDGEVENKGLEANAHLIKTAPKLYAFIELLQLSVADDIKRDELLAEARGE